MKKLTKSERHKLYKAALLIFREDAHKDIGLCWRFFSILIDKKLIDLNCSYSLMIEMLPEFSKYRIESPFWFESNFHRIEALKEMINATKP
jgi:hypothetical protein